MSKREKPATIYAAAINSCGLWYRTPMRCTFNENLNEWYDKSGNFSVKKLGVVARCEYITFAHENKKEVQTWISGVMAAQRILRDWSTVPNPSRQ